MSHEPKPSEHAMTGRMIDCEMDIRGLHLVGMTCETKTELVPVSRYDSRFHKDRKGLDDYERSPSVDAILAPFEKDGWYGRSSDIFNGHRYVQDEVLGKCQRVSFTRYVNPETGKPVKL